MKNTVRDFSSKNLPSGVNDLTAYRLQQLPVTRYYPVLPNGHGPTRLREPDNNSSNEAISKHLINVFSDPYRDQMEDRVQVRRACSDSYKKGDF